MLLMLLSLLNVLIPFMFKWVSEYKGDIAKMKKKFATYMNKLGRDNYRKNPELNKLIL